MQMTLLTCAVILAHTELFIYIIHPKYCSILNTTTNTLKQIKWFDGSLIGTTGPLGS